MSDQGLTRRDILQAGTGLLGASIFGAASAQPNPTLTAQLSALTGEERIKRLAEGAKKEGLVSIYTSMPVDDMAALTAAFEAKYGVKAKVWRSGSEKILQRGTTEFRAKRYEVDVFETNGPEVEALNRENMLVECHSSALSDLIEQAVPSHRRWIATRLNIFTCSYNTNLVKKEDLPKTYQDLLDPKWKDRLAVEADDSDWLAETVMHMGEEKGLALFKEIARKNMVSVRKGHTLMSQLVASGEVPMALTTYNYITEKMKKKGAPIEWFALSPTVARPNCVAVASHAPHPHAALLFQEFELTEGQALLGKRNFIPTSKKVKSPLNQMPLIFANPKTTLDDGNKWQKVYEEVFSRKG